MQGGTFGLVMVTRPVGHGRTGWSQSSCDPLPASPEGALRFSKTLPPPHLLILSSPQNPRSLGGDVASDGDFLIFEGNRYSRKGFLFKSFAMSAVVRVP